MPNTLTEYKKRCLVEKQNERKRELENFKLRFRFGFNLKKKGLAKSFVREKKRTLNFFAGKKKMMNTSA